MITIKYEDGSTQVVRPSEEHFMKVENGKITPQQLSDKVRGLVYAIAADRPFENYFSTYTIQTSNRKRKR